MKYISKDNLYQYDGLIKNYISDKASNIQELLAYGVQWSEDQADPHLTRIGNMTMHKTLPIQNNMKGVIAQKSKIMYYLDENDWRWRATPLTVNLAITDNTIINDIFSTKQYEKQWLKINNEEVQVVNIDTTTKTATLDKTPASTGKQVVELGAVLNGYDGTVRVKVPRFWIKAYKDGLIRQVWISPTYIDDSWAEQPCVLIDAYKSTLLNTVPTNMGYLSTLKVGELISVQNTSAYCRGGNNRDNFDGYDEIRTDLGKPRTALNITATRTQQVDQHILSYYEYKNILYWLYVIEYANFNSQEAFNDTLTSEGYRQGGLGKGVSNIIWDYWGLLNNQSALIPNGYTNNIGNGTNVRVLSNYVANLTTNNATIKFYSINSAIISATTSNSTITVTDVVKSNYTGISILWYRASGIHKYKIEGLQENQYILFKSGNYSKPITRDGEYDINWAITNRLIREIQFSFTGQCNIKITIVQSNTANFDFTFSPFNVPRWHGIEQPFGDTYTVLDGVLINNIDANNEANMYICKNPEQFSNTLTSNYKLIGITLLQEGFNKYWKYTQEADLITQAIGGTPTTYICDYNYLYNNVGNMAILVAGGHSAQNEKIGIGCLTLFSTATSLWLQIGMRSVSFGFDYK